MSVSRGPFAKVRCVRVGRQVCSLNRALKRCPDTLCATSTLLDVEDLGGRWPTTNDANHRGFCATAGRTNSAGDVGSFAGIEGVKQSRRERKRPSCGSHTPPCFHKCDMKC